LRVLRTRKHLKFGDFPMLAEQLRITAKKNCSSDRKKEVLLFRRLPYRAAQEDEALTSDAIKLVSQQHIAANP